MHLQTIYGGPKHRIIGFKQESRGLFPITDTWLCNQNLPKKILKKIYTKYLIYVIECKLYFSITDCIICIQFSFCYVYFHLFLLNPDSPRRILPQSWAHARAARLKLIPLACMSYSRPQYDDWAEFQLIPLLLKLLLSLQEELKSGSKKQTGIAN